MNAVTELSEMHYVLAGVYLKIPFVQRIFKITLERHLLTQLEAPMVDNTIMMQENVPQWKKKSGEKDHVRMLETCPTYFIIT